MNRLPLWHLVHVEVNRHQQTSCLEIVLDTTYEICPVGQVSYVRKQNTHSGPDTTGQGPHMVRSAIAPDSEPCVTDVLPETAFLN